MKQNEIIPRLTARHMSVYALYRDIERRELEQRENKYKEEYRYEPQCSQLYGTLQALERLMDLGWMLSQRWSERELVARLQQRYGDWCNILTYHREVKAGYQRGLTEIARYQAG